MHDSFDLDRFVAAQDGVLSAVRAELAAGFKRTHWMWFVFPQLKALGRSATALHYGLAGRDEAQAYWRHPVLGPRLREHTALVLGVPAPRSAHDIFHSPDDLKFRSCMTLFAEIAPDEALFRRALQRFFDGPDQRTLELLR
jgi:uncharacterized protein (DUF1810 family)